MITLRPLTSECHREASWMDRLFRFTPSPGHHYHADHELDYQYREVPNPNPGCNRRMFARFSPNRCCVCGHLEWIRQLNSEQYADERTAHHLN